MKVESLSSEQKEQITTWVDEGLDLNLLQKAINEAWEMRLTFMEVRFLVLDLGLTIKTPAASEPKPAPVSGASMPTPPPVSGVGSSASGMSAGWGMPTSSSPMGSMDTMGMGGASMTGTPTHKSVPPSSMPMPGSAPAASMPGTGKIKLSVDEVINPSYAISGKFVFPSGAYGAWYIDTAYRVGLEPAEGSTEPTETDITLFERELKQFLRNHLGGI